MRVQRVPLQERRCRMNDPGSTTPYVSEATRPKPRPPNKRSRRPETNVFAALSLEPSERRI
jgi:hypothetical protein